MWPISTRFAAALTGGHVVATKVEIVSSGGDVLADLSDQGVVVAGTVTVSRNDVSRTATLSLIDRNGTLTPRDVDDLLAPGGNQVRIWRGIRFPTTLADGSADVEYVPIGTFRYTKVDTRFPKVDLGTCFDRGWVAAGNKQTDTVSIAKGTNLVVAVDSLIERAYPGLPRNLPVTDEVVNSMTFDPETDLWASAIVLCANIGLRLYIDPMGVVQARPEATDNDPIVWDYDDTNRANTALADITRSWDGTRFNGVMVVAENTSLPSPIRSAAYDTNPNSPTQWGGRFGRRLAPFIKDGMIASQAQCDARARKELAAVVGLLQSISIPTVTNPAYEINDSVRVNVTRADLTSLPLISEQTCVVDSFDIPLRASGTQTLQTRARQVVSA